MCCIVDLVKLSYSFLCVECLVNVELGNSPLYGSDCLKGDAQEARQALGSRADGTVRDVDWRCSTRFSPYSQEGLSR